MSSSLPDLQKERGFPHPSKKKKLLKSKRESTRSDPDVRKAFRSERAVNKALRLVIELRKVGSYKPP
jgi:hypothetical protein